MSNRQDEAARNEIQSKADRLAAWMDDAIVIPGTKIRVGWDCIIGLLPGIGDTATLISHILMLRHAMRAGVRKRVYLLILTNALLDWLIGLVPVLGDVLDVFWRANRRNADLIRKEIARKLDS